MTAQDPTEHLRIVLFGKTGGTIRGEKYKTPMPAWKYQLSDEEVAAVINHERTAGGTMLRPLPRKKLKRYAAKEISNRYGVSTHRGGGCVQTLRIYFAVFHS